MRDLTGHVVDGRYRLLSRLGEGAHGQVWKAYDAETGVEVAVKLLRKDTAGDPEFHERLVREATAMSSLRGTAAVHIIGSGGERGSFYIAMDLLLGENFEDYLDRLERAAVRMDPATLVWMLKPIVETLDLAHSRGIVHRDLKPANIFLIDPNRGGGVRLLDFGLAKFLKAKSMTAHGMVAGTPSYIAPEAWKGNPTLLDHRIDIYSLGAIVFRALSGRVPFEGENLMEKLKQVTQGERPSLHALRPDLPADIDWWVRQVLAIDPNHRFLRVTGMWNALRQLLT